MSGFGIHEQHAAGVEIAELGKRWREDAFLHQLSHNGSLMLAVNHDALWRECLERILGQPTDSSWERMSGLLRAMPAHEARKRLWHASQLWWLNMTRHRLRALTQALRSGALTELAAQPALRSLATQLELRGMQLTDLEWVLADTDDDTISVIDDEPAHASAVARPRRRR